MSKARRWVIILLSLAVLVLIGINTADKDDTAQVVVNTSDPTYKASTRTPLSIARKAH